MSASLYQLNDRYAAMFELACDESTDEGEISAEFTAILSALSDEIDHKLESCCMVMQNMIAMEAAADAEARRLATKAARVERRLQRLKDYVRDAMEQMGYTKRQCGLFSLRIQANSMPSVNVIAEDLVPREFYVQPPPVLSKSAVLEAVKSGAVVPGVEVVRGSHIRWS